MSEMAGRFYVDQGKRRESSIIEFGKQVYAGATWKAAEFGEWLHASIGTSLTELFEPVSQKIYAISERRELRRTSREQLKIFENLRLLSQFPLIEIIGYLQGDAFQRLTSDQKDIYLERIALLRLHQGDPEEAKLAQGILDRIKNQRTVEETMRAVASYHSQYQTT